MLARMGRGWTGAKIRRTKKTRVKKIKQIKKKNWLGFILIID